MQRYANVIHMLLSKFGESCLSTKYSDYVQILQKTDWETSGSTCELSALVNGKMVTCFQLYMYIFVDRPWYYQTCTEYGYYQTSSRANDTFGRRFPVDFFIKMCQDVFNSK